MNIEISNRQSRRRVNRKKLSSFSRWLMERIEDVDPGRNWTTLSVILVDDEGMIPIQRACFGANEPTDVISLAYDPIPPEGDGRDGEVIVNVQRAHEVGGADGCSRELALYLAHGCQHLTGASDETPALRAAMRRKETAWLNTAERLGLLTGLIQEPERPSAQ